ncbi:hypothetical protein [Micromonospora sp. NBC_01796]|uniref:hypothetical protein n=1 Tax=Micromonospora sp. NBC_01796 TaxID=2975987 RepID=UPI002DD93D8B|nr:hypothetical protein [Micromonospora sp. NBC_01796]WSA85598.1 hypothetical protein OIE47_35510 [Micromonospora sp. NBC_01796]
MGQVRRMLDEDLANHPAPPLGDLIEQAMKQGTRIRRRRRYAAWGAGSATLALLLAFVLALGPLDLRTRQSRSAGTPDLPWQPTTTASTAPKTKPARTPDPVGPTTLQPPPRVVGRVGIPPRPGGQWLTATPAGLLELLTRLLPEGTTSGFAASTTVANYVQVYLDRGDGPGMLRLEVFHLPAGDAEPVGTAQLQETPSNCVQDRYVWINHGDGVGVSLAIATCLAADGSDNPPGVAALTTDEAVAILADPRWGTELPAELVTAGAARFPDLAPLR